MNLNELDLLIKKHATIDVEAIVDGEIEFDPEDDEDEDETDDEREQDFLAALSLLESVSNQIESLLKSCKTGKSRIVHMKELELRELGLEIDTFVSQYDVVDVEVDGEEVE